jgi:pimeloyl-ACP methyl ester carboxylesterase
MNTETPLRFLAGVPAESSVISVLGVDLAVARQGSGIPLVCLHAIGHGGADFEPLVERVGDRFEIIRIDWPGQGRSGEDREPASALRYAQLLESALDQLGIRDPIIIGNSIGGAAALIYAKSRVVRGLVLCDTGGLVALNHAVRKICSVFARFFRAGARGAAWFPLAYRAYYRWLVLPSSAATEQRERIIRCGRETAQVLAEGWESFSRDEADIREIALSLDVPVWFAWSKGDRVIPLSYNLDCIRAMKRARVTTFPGGHAAFLERPDQFAEDFLAFVWELPRKGASLRDAGKRVNWPLAGWQESEQPR